MGWISLSPTSRFPSALKISLATSLGLGKSLGRQGCTTQCIPPLGIVCIQYAAPFGSVWIQRFLEEYWSKSICKKISRHCGIALQSSTWASKKGTSVPPRISAAISAHMPTHKYLCKHLSRSRIQGFLCSKYHSLGPLHTPWFEQPLDEKGVSGVPP